MDPSSKSFIFSSNVYKSDYNANSNLTKEFIKLGNISKDFGR